jgi:hypothetical protein
MEIQALNELSYKELQGKAKEFSIPANQKKEVLIHELFSRLQVNDENNSTAFNVEVKVQVQEKAVPATPLAARPTRTTRSTVKKAQLVAAPVDEMEETVVIPEVKVVSQAPIQEEEIVLKSFVDEPSVVDELANDTTIVVDSPVAEAAAPVSESIESMASPQVESEQLESVEEPQYDEEVEYPNPTTLFDAEDDEEEQESDLEEAPTRMGPKIAVNRHVYFTSPDAKSHATLDTAQTAEGTKHMHFASPELQLGRGVHWTYEEYNGVKAEMAAEKPAAQEAPVASKQEEEKKKLPKGHSDKVMSFWLTKAFAKPVSNFFN